MQKRKVDIVVISDVHLGTYGCKANELLQYLRSIEPNTLVLNGDIIDIWQFSKRYWPESHTQVLKKLMGFIADGVNVHYITGNHDELLRKFVGFNLGTFEIANKVVLELTEGKAWFFHGDVFDVTMKYSKWLAKLGATGYGILIFINKMVNITLHKLGKGKVSLSKKIKDSVKGAVGKVNNFEITAADIAISNGYQYVLCGHIHKPTIKTITTDNGAVTYLNSGDWVENLTALEYNNHCWKIYHHDNAELNKSGDSDIEEENFDNDLIFQKLLNELNVTILK